jgi:uncharacterized protein (DUF1330 family)
MKTHHTIALAMLAGFGLGTVAVQGLHAQAKAPVYQVTEVDVVNPEAYAKDFAPKAAAAVKAAGGKFLAVGGKTTALDGDPPKSRIVISQWDSIEKIKAYRRLGGVQGNRADPRETGESPHLCGRGRRPIKL